MSNSGNVCCRKLKLLHYICFIFFIFHLSLQSSPDDDDAACLLRFRTSLPDASILRNWFAGGNACLFHGVYCNDSRVIAVDLSFLPLNSDIKSVTHSLLSLKRLQKLSLSSTNLTGALSSVPPRCSESLTELDLSNNALSGSVSGLSVFSICVGLKYLNLSRNALVSSTDDLVFNLQSLDLSSNRISGTVSFSDCGDLDYLDISSNNFSAEVPSFSECSSLRHLDLSDNKFFGEVANRLSNLSNLQFLNLSSNDFNGSIPAIYSSLKFLYLANNEFDDGLIQTGLDCSLLELDVSFNKLSGKIPQSCSSLSYVNIANNRFSGEIDDLIKFTDLKKLVVSYNYLTGSLPESFSELTRIEILDASSNNFSGSIPNLCKNSSNSLKELYLQNNLFSGKIPASLSNCSMMNSLDLSFNFLTGSIPASFGTLYNLRDLMIWMNKLHGEIPPEIGDLKFLENLILDFNELTGEIPSSLANCLNLNWISLSNNELTGQIPPWIGNLKSLAILELGNNSIHGEIPSEIGNCSSLIWLDLNTNFLSGGIPPELFKQSGKIAVGLITGKRYAYIKNDGSSKSCHGAGNLVEFSGIRQEDLSRVSSRSPCNFTRVYGGNTQATFSLNGSIIFLDLSYNSINGKIPKETGSMFYVQVLNVGHNNLSGEIPAELGNLAKANIIDLSNNNLNGSIPPSMTKLSMLAELDLSNNHLQGVIPQSSQFESFPAERYGNNSGLCGYPLPPCARTIGVADSHRRRRSASLAGSVAMGLLFSVFCIFALSVVAVEVRKRKRKETVDMNMDMDIHVDPQSQSVTFAGNWKFTGGVEALSTNLAIFDKPLRKLTFGDLMEATNGFHAGTLIGSGGFGDVYKAELKDGTLVAIKKLIHVSGQGEREFTAEMETIGKIKHRNLVPLLGYCKVGEERLLVYEFMKYGSLEDVLHDRKKKGVKLNWSARRRIAIGAARGLAFLHHNCVPHIIHRDMKSSNVLLDENLEARVSDFGMARLMSAMETHLSVSTLAGTPGYVPPEYYQSFRCSTRGDVYSYGVVLLELLTGKPPTDSADFGDNNLVGWVKQHAKTKISGVFDPYLMNNDDPAMEMELLQHLKVACACLDDRSWRRPTMIQVMAMFKEIQAGSGMDSASTIDDAATPAAALQMMTIIKEAN